jgi:4-amino-4-deoxy-L-arabinose transferase-like glycosyltransferase
MRSLLLIAAAGVVLRLLAVAPLHTGGPTSDERDYLHIAYRLAGGGDFVDLDGEYSKRAPLFPGLMAVLLRIFGDRQWVLYLVNAMFGGLVVLLTGLLAAALWRDPALSRGAAWASALYPGLIAYGAVLQTESLYIVLFLGAMVFVVRFLEVPAWWTAAGFGVAAGLATLTRAVFLGFFPLLLALMVFTGRRRAAEMWRGLALAVLLFCVVLAPWTWRNFQVHHALIPVSSVGGRLMLFGNNPYATGTWSTRAGFNEWYRDELRRRGVDDPASLTEAESESLDARIGWEYAVSHPVQTAGIMLKKAQIFWFYPVTTSDSDRPLQAVAVLADLFLLLAAMLGLVRMRAPAVSLLPVWGALVYFTAVCLLLQAEARYRLPLIPFVCLAAGWTALPLPGKQEWADLVRRRERRVRWVAAGVLTIVAAYAITAWMVFTGSIS